MNNPLIDKTKATGKSLRKLASIGLAAAVLSTALGASGPALAAICNNVNITFENLTEDDIRVTRLRFQDLDDNTTNPREQGIPNVFCPPMSECNTGPNGTDIGSLIRPARNHELRDWQIQHQHRDENGNWGNRVWTPVRQTDGSESCTNGHTYGRFAIR